MNNSRTFTVWSLAVAAILLSPILVIFSIPLMIGVGLDIFELVGVVPFALALFAPVALVLLRLLPLRALAHRLGVLALDVHDAPASPRSRSCATTRASPSGCCRT